MTEAWRPVVGYEGIYEVSDAGNVRRSGRVLKFKKHTRGYRQVTLWKYGEAKYPLVHTLVAAAFIGPCPDGYEVNHINGAKADNHLANIEYVTRSENHIHRARVLGKCVGGGHANSKLSEAIVKAARQRHAAGESGYALATEFGVSKMTMWHALKRNTWKHVL